MENPTVAGLRSRSRSKTPFLRSSCDREQCAESEDHVHHKAGRKTPVKRSTPIKQLQSKTRESVDVIEEDPDNEVPTAYRARQTSRTTEKLVKTSDYSSEESLDRLKGHRKEIVQNEINSQYERVSTSSQRYRNLEDLPFSPIHSSHNVTQDRSTRFGSPAYSACSTDSSFAEQALADASALLEREPISDHLPYRLYKMAGEYWNKYPKTDYTYSRLSRDRVELAPGQVAVPNMSRRSLSQFRVQGPLAADVTDVPARIAPTWRATATRSRYKGVDSSDDESAYVHNGMQSAVEERWWITTLLATILTSVGSTASNAYRRIVGPSHRYPYTERRPARASIASMAASALGAPFLWIYSIVKKAVTTTVTTITETITPNHVGESEKYVARSYKSKGETKRRAWPWMLLLLLPALGYGLNYTYANYEHLSMPNFTDFQIDLSEFYALELPKIAMPNISLADLNVLPSINLTLPEINITMPDVAENMPRVTKAYREYKDIVHNRMTDASEYLTVVAESCYEEMRRFWRGIIG